ncbi:MAG: hydantoinase/oxoprolinase N-terminal domain-containing protein [Pararhizobium sp.]
MLSPSPSLLSLGIDTGGTYTDAVVYSDQRGVLAKAKALTTRHDLAVGIAAAVEAVLAEAAVPPSAIGLVSLSTTLATNALVEGHGGRAGLVMIGFTERDLKRDGLAAALGGDPVLFLPGGHDVHGNEAPLELFTLEEALPRLKHEVSAVAVAGYFAVRNPAHEIRARALIHQKTALPVTCSHELSSRLGGPRRALTTLLNARLVTTIDRLIGACARYLEQRGIAARLMVVRGDGALISADEALLRPIETILSGPAARLVGARHLTGLANAVVSDIGGTTTDVAVLEAGRPRLDAEGALVGGHRTMVEAVAMRTFGLGGDSEVRLDDRQMPARLVLGPRRVLPLSLAAHLDPDAVLPVLEAQLRAPQAGRLDGRFACRSGLPDALATGLQPQERALYDRLPRAPVALAALLASTSQRATLDRLVERGLAHHVGFTPSDALHVLGRQGHWNAEAARLGALLVARRKDGAGNPFAATPEAAAEAVVAQLTRQSAEAVLSAALAEDGTAIDPAASVSVDRALRRTPGIVRFALSLDRPLIGLGAAAGAYYPAIAAMVGAESVVPDDADVANAIGAVVGHVRETATVVVTSPEDGIFMAGGAEISERFLDEQQALGFARAHARRSAGEAAARSGAEEPLVELVETVEAPVIKGLRKFIEARIVAVASGRPAIAAPAFSDSE